MRTLAPMRRLLATAVLVVLVAACGGGGDSDPADTVAAQAERVATLLDRGEDCRALEATATLQTLAEDAALDESARDAAAQWAERARQHLSCEPSAPPEPAEPRDRDPGEGDDEDDEEDEEKDKEGDGGGTGTKGRDEDRGNGPPDDRGKDDD